MVRNTQNTARKTLSPAPVQTTEKTVEAPSQEGVTGGEGGAEPDTASHDVELETVVSTRSHRDDGKPSNRDVKVGWERNKAQMVDAVSGKARFKAIVSQKLAEAVDLYKEGAAKDTEAGEIAAIAARLMVAEVAGHKMPRDEVSDILIQQFGAVPMKDGKPGKTPAGKGGEIRKRIIRLCDAADYIAASLENAPLDDKRYTTFYKGLPVEEVQTVLDRVLQPADELEKIGAEPLTIWSSYNKLDEIAKAAKVDQSKPKAAFDHKAIAAIVGDLAGPGDPDENGNKGVTKVAHIIWKAPALRAAYYAMHEQLAIIGDILAVLDEEALNDNDGEDEEEEETPPQQVAAE